MSSNVQGLSVKAPWPPSLSDRYAAMMLLLFYASAVLLLCGACAVAVCLLCCSSCYSAAADEIEPSDQADASAAAIHVPSWSHDRAQRTRHVRKWSECEDSTSVLHAYVEYMCTVHG